jgi:hypothetical protein
MYGRTDDPEFSHVEGYEDHSVNLLCTWDREGALTGLAVNIACPSQASETSFKISADFWHDTRTELRGRPRWYRDITAAYRLTNWYGTVADRFNRGSGTYLPTARAVSGKSYGAIPASTPVGPEGGRELVEWTVSAINALWDPSA